MGFGSKKIIQNQSERTVKLAGNNPVCAYNIFEYYILTAVRSIGTANLLLRLIVTLAEYSCFMMNKGKP